MFPDRHLYFCTGCGKLFARGAANAVLRRVPWKMVRTGFSLKPTYYFAGLRFSVHFINGEHSELRIPEESISISEVWK
jgi:hypothetical protein